MNQHQRNPLRPSARSRAADSPALIVFLAALLAVTAAQASQGESYRIGPRDVLEIRVFDLDQLNSTVRVSEAGTIELPVIGEIVATGMTQNDLAEAIEQALSRFVNDPQVFVVVSEYQSQRFSTIGAVGSPGIYPMVGRTTLLEAISMAGGVSNDETSGTVRIIREGFSGAPIEIDLDELLERGNSAFNISVKAGDVINVVRKEAYVIYITGEVRSPGQFDLREPITLLKAVSMAGGLAERAAASKIQILRARPDGTQERIKVNLDDIRNGKAPDIPLLANDIVVVPQTFF